MYYCFSQIHITQQNHLQSTLPKSVFQSVGTENIASTYEGLVFKTIEYQEKRT